MLSLLLDENVSPEVARQIAQKRPEILVVSVHSWKDGQFEAKRDEVILAAAAPENLTLVTYDQRTIMPLLVQWAHTEKEHAGVVFVDDRTITPSDFGTLIRSLIALWESSNDEDWKNAVVYLKSDG